MKKILVIAEKPSVASDIAKVLKCKSRSDGFFSSEDYIVSWAIGHLVTLKDPEDYDPKNKKWSFSTLPMIPENIDLKAVEKTKKQLKILKALFSDKEVTELICATDSGREGELIFRYIYSILNCKKPFKRLWISSMTDTAIKEGFKNLKDGNLYDSLYYSAKCRSEADWLVGINATRAYTLKYNTLLSIGRVQTPTLAILTERQKEIDAFVSKDYWEIKGDFGEFAGMWFDEKTKETKIFDKDKATSISKKVDSQKAVVFSVEEEEKKTPPPLLFDLTELQRECNKKFSYSAKKTLEIAQNLYEKRKMITYPRTDSRYLSDDMIPKLPSLLKKLENSDYSSFAKYILSLAKLPISKRIIDNAKITDHHAIIPTDVVINTKTLSDEEFKVYDIIVKRFLSIFYPTYIYNVTTIILEVKDEFFLAKGTVIKQKGWTEITKIETKKNDSENESLPNLKKDEEVFLKKAEVLQKKTQPPKSYTEAMLLSAMENAGRFVEDEDLKEQLKDSGLGTPATRAAIIERLLQVNYIYRKGKALCPTEKGMKLIEILPNELKSPETTGKWEKGLTSIYKGTMEAEKFMSSINRYVYYIIDSSKKSSEKVVFPTEETKNTKIKVLGNCPKCETGKILENSKAYYCSSWKNGCKFTTWKNSLDIYGESLDIKKVKELLLDKKIENINIVFPQTNEKCTADLVFTKDMSGKVELINLKRIRDK